MCIRDRQQPAQLGGVHVPLEQAECGLQLARGRGVQPALQREQLGGGREAVARHRHHGRARRQLRGQRQDVRARPLVQRQQHTGDRRGPGGVRGQRADDQVGAVPGGDDQAAGGQGVQEVRQHGAAEDEVEGVAGQSGVVAEEHLAAERTGDLGDGRGGERLVLRQHVAGHGQPGGQPLGHGVPVLGGHPVDDHGHDVAAQALVGAVGALGLGADRLGGVLDVAHDGDDHRAQLVGQAGIERQLVGEVGVGVVGAEDEHDLVVAGRAVIAVDEPGDELVGALLGQDRGGLAVFHAVRGRRVLVDPVAGPEELEEPVRCVVQQRPVDTDPRRLSGQQLHDPQFDDLSAVPPLDTGHVHAARHAGSPSVASIFPDRVALPLDNTSADG